MLDLHRLRLLREFAGRGTIAATAAALGYTASAVSQQLSVLERETGTALLDRAARSVELTDAGRRLAVHAEIILAQAEAAEADLAAQEEQPSGRVCVAAFPSAAAAFAPALVRSMRRHPRLTLLLQQAAPDEGLRRVRSGEADVALVDDWSGGLPDHAPATLRCYPLMRDPVVLIVPRDHPLADPAVPVDLRLLRETTRWMAAPAGEPSRHAVDQVLGAVGGTPAVPWEFEGLGTIVSLVARGVGVALVPRLALATGERRVAVRELAGSAPAREVYAVARAASAHRPSVAVILAALAAGASSLRAARPAGETEDVAPRQAKQAGEARGAAPRQAKRAGEARGMAPKSAGEARDTAKRPPKPARAPR
jgi:DNA-binding transcriptional LysR family regulator